MTLAKPVAMRTTLLTIIKTHFQVTGAIAPSSARLAKELAHLATGSDHVLELGAGKGAVTLALTKVVNPVNVQVVEVQEELASTLKQKYPDLHILQGTAQFALDNYRNVGAVSVVSSLPFRSLPASVKRPTVQSLLRFLAASPGSRLIQFTYGWREPFSVSSEFKWQQVKWVIANLPPACIWVLTKSPV